ncbi:MAG: methionyl-tRNA formyltransferase [Patescibacteria group bacterium]|nr:methionyl-tRNA formyltransferase [Patescibacteria group bacterium]
MRIIFFGTPRFAEIVLQKIIADRGYEILAVVTTPDELVGRKQILTAPPVKILAEKNGLKVLQPEKLDEEFYNELQSILPFRRGGAPQGRGVVIGNDNHPEPIAIGSPLLRKEGITTENSPVATAADFIDLFIVAAYGKIIPQKFLDLPKFGCLNIHPSLLPKYRGASPIQSALLNGEKETGVTIMKMDEKMDHGAIISNFQFPISNDDTYEILSEKLAQASGDFLLTIIPDYLSNKIKPAEQDHTKATFCKIIKKSDGEIDWNKPAKKIYNQWRAFWPWPGAFASMKALKHESIKALKQENIKIKFIELFLVDEKNEKHTPGELFAENGKLFVAGGDRKLLEIKKLQPEGKKVMEAKEFINGYLQTTLSS